MVDQFLANAAEVRIGRGVDPDHSHLQQGRPFTLRDDPADHDRRVGDRLRFVTGAFGRCLCFDVFRHQRGEDVRGEWHHAPRHDRHAEEVRTVLEHRFRDLGRWDLNAEIEHFGSGGLGGHRNLLRTSGMSIEAGCPDDEERPATVPCLECFARHPCGIEIERRGVRRIAEDHERVRWPVRARFFAEDRSSFARRDAAVGALHEGFHPAAAALDRLPEMTERHGHVCGVALPPPCVELLPLLPFDFRTVLRFVLERGEQSCPRAFREAVESDRRKSVGPPGLQVHAAVLERGDALTLRQQQPALDVGEAIGVGIVLIDRLDVASCRFHESGGEAFEVACAVKLVLGAPDEELVARTRLAECSIRIATEGPHVGLVEEGLLRAE